jgi:hypothetical protein
MGLLERHPGVLAPWTAPGPSCTLHICKVGQPHPQVIWSRREGRLGVTWRVCYSPLSWCSRGQLLGKAARRPCPSLPYLGGTEVASEQALRSSESPEIDLSPPQANVFGIPRVSHAHGTSHRRTATFSVLRGHVRPWDPFGHQRETSGPTGWQPWEHSLDSPTLLAGTADLRPFPDKSF